MPHMQRKITWWGYGCLFYYRDHCPIHRNLILGVTSIGLCLREFKKINSNKAYLKKSVSAVELWMSLHNKW